MNLEEYRKRGLHLPPELRDFHDQKDVFKSIFGNRVIEGKELTWVDQQIYIFDYFLWIMAAYGYELRRTKRRVERASLSDAVTEHRKLQIELLKKIFQESSEKKIDDEKS